MVLEMMGNDSIGSSGGIEVKVEVKTEEDVDGGDNGGDDENENGDGDDHGDQDDDYDVEGDVAKVDPPSPASREFRNLSIPELCDVVDHREVISEKLLALAAEIDVDKVAAFDFFRHDHPSTKPHTVGTDLFITTGWVFRSGRPTR